MPFKRMLQVPRLDVPHTNGIVIPATRQPLRIWREDDAAHAPFAPLPYHAL